MRLLGQLFVRCSSDLVTNLRTLDNRMSVAPKPKRKPHTPPTLLTRLVLARLRGLC